ncbi:zf-CCHC domain-containing protein [Tanacetum coccineum]|uniref:Zf-CCHC domain-containing protein n=1 Tax=Tanacetum coccineum TaxID=301880 RepID=A0ABQ5HEE5_9ASTR
MAYPLPSDTTYPTLCPIHRIHSTDKYGVFTSIGYSCMTRSSTNKLFTLYKELEREFRSSRRNFKSLSLDELRSPDFNLFSYQEYSEEEEAKAMAETMEQYMSKTQTDYGLGVARPKIDNKDQFELKGQFLKELRENTFSGSNNEDANERIEKVLEIVDLFHVPNITEVILFYNGLDVPTRQILDSRGVIPSKTATDAKLAIKEMAEYSQKWHTGTFRGRSTETSDGLAVIQAQLNNLGRDIKKVNEKVYVAQVGCGGYRATAPGYYQRNNANPSNQEQRQSMGDTLSKFISESAKRHDENSNLIKEIRAAIEAAIRNQGALIKTLEIQIGQMSKVLQERGFRSLPSSTETNPRDQVKSISATIEADSHSICRIRSSQYAVSNRQNSTLFYKLRQMTVPFPSCLDNHYCEEEEGIPCFINNTYFNNALVDLGASVSVMPLSTYLNLELGELAHTKLTLELADRTVKYPKGIAKNVLVRIGKFTFPIDFIIIDMHEDIKVPLILRRPLLSTAHAKIDVYKINITLRVGEEKIVFTSVKSASSLIKRVYMLSLKERMELDLEARLMGETLVLNRSSDSFLEDYIELNDLNEPLELRRNQGDDLMPTIKEGEVIEEFRTRDDELNIGIDDYPSYCDYDKKIHLDCAHNLKIEQYFQVQDYALWDVIKNGNSFKPTAQTTTNVEGTSTTLIPSPVTADEKVQKRNDVKARSMLLMALPNEHLLTFNQYKDAKTLFATIQTRFGGNDATKKTQKTNLKQIHENFSAPSTESLDSIFNRLQNIWNTHVVVWRNKPDLNPISFDDLYNNFKIVEQEVKGTASLSSNSSSQNMAFVSSPSSTNEINIAYEVSTANSQVIPASTQVSTASSQVSTANLSDAIVYAFFANQPNGSQLVYEDLEQIHEDDLEEMDLKWQLALLSMRTRMFFQKTSRKITINGSDTAGYDKSKSYMADDEVPTNMALMAFPDSKEFQKPEFEGYGPKTSKSVSEDISIEVGESHDALLVEELMLDDKLEKKTVFPTVAKIEFADYYCSKLKKAHPSAHKNMVPKEVLMKTGLRPLNTTRPKAVNTARPNTSVVNVVRANQIQVSDGAWSPMDTNFLITYVQGHPQKEIKYVNSR